VQGDVDSFDADARSALELVLSQRLSCGPPSCFLTISSVTPASVALRVQMTVPDDPSALPGGGSSAADSDATASTVARRTRTLLSQTPAQLSTALSVGVQGVALLSVQAGLTVPLVLSQDPASPAPLGGGGAPGGGATGGDTGDSSDLRASEGDGVSVTTMIAAGAGGLGGVLCVLLLTCCYRRRCHRSAVPRAQIASPTTHDRGRQPPKGKRGRRDRWPAQGMQMQQSTTTAQPPAFAPTTSHHAWPVDGPPSVATISSTADDHAILQQKVAKAQAADNLLGQLIVSLPPAATNLPFTSQMEDSTPRASGDQSPSSSSSRSQATPRTPRTPREDARGRFVDRSRRSAASALSQGSGSGASSPTDRAWSPTAVLPATVPAAVPHAATFIATAEAPPTPRLEGEGNFDWANYAAGNPAPASAIGEDVFLPDELYDADDTAVYV